MTEAEARAEFIRQAMGDAPPWWAECIADHLQAAEEGAQLRVIVPRRLLVQQPDGRLALAEREHRP